MLVLLRYLPLPKPSPPDLRPALDDAKGDVREVWRRPTLREAATILFFAACLASAAFLAYVVPQDLTLNHSYITFFPLLLIAGWYGLEWAAATLFANVCIALFTAANFESVESVALQFGLVTLTYLGILLGAFASERKWSAARLQRHAFHDTLTGLPNRAFFWSVWNAP